MTRQLLSHPLGEMVWSKSAQHAALSSVSLASAASQKHACVVRSTEGLFSKINSSS